MLNVTAVYVKRKFVLEDSTNVLDVNAITVMVVLAVLKQEEICMKWRLSQIMDIMPKDLFQMLLGRNVR